MPELGGLKASGWVVNIGHDRAEGSKISVPGQVALSIPKQSKFHRYQFPLVDGHTSRCCWLEVVHINTAVVALLLDRRLPQQMGLEASAVVVHAVESIDDRADQQEDSQHGKGRQTLAYRHVLGGTLIDTEKLEDEVGQASEKECDDAQRAGPVFVAGTVSCSKKDKNRNGHGSYSGIVLGPAVSANDDNELHRKSEEEEKVKLQQSNVDLEQISQ